MNQTSAPTGTETYCPEAGVPLYALDRPDEHFPAYLFQKNGDYFLFRTRQDLALGRQLVTIDQGLRIEIEVVYRQRRADGAFEIGCKAIAAEKGSVRREWRIPVDLSATVSLKGSETSYKGRVLNMSTAGLGLQLPTEVASGSEIVVRMSDGVGFGQVRHCRRVNHDTYIVGVHLDRYLEADQTIATGTKEARLKWFSRVSRCLSAVGLWKA